MGFECRKVCEFGSDGCSTIVSHLIGVSTKLKDVSPS